MSRIPSLCMLLVLATMFAAAQAQSPSAALQRSTTLLIDHRYDESESVARQGLAAERRDSDLHFRLQDVVVEARSRSQKLADGTTLALAHQLLAEKERRYGVNAPEVATTLVTLGTILYGMSQFEDSQAVLLRAVSIREQALGPDHPDTGIALREYGASLHEASKYEEATKPRARALAIHRRAFPAGHRELGRTLISWAWMLRQNGDLAAGRTFGIEGLAMLEKTAGARHPDLLPALTFLAASESHLGNLRGTRAATDRAFKILGATVGLDHPDAAAPHRFMAMALSNTGDYVRAKESYEQALRLYKRMYGAKHRRVASILDGLGDLTRVLGQYEKSKRYYREAIEIAAATWGPDSQVVGGVSSFLAIVHFEAGEYVEAKAIYQRAFELYRKNNFNHPDLATDYAAYGDILNALGEYGEAEENYKKAIVIFEDSFGPAFPWLGFAHAGYAKLLFSVGRKAEAIRRALVVEKNGRDHMRVSTRVLPEREALLYARQRVSGIYLALSFLVDAPQAQPAVASEVYDAIVRSRALVLDEMSARHLAVARTDDQGVARIYRSLLAARERLAAGSLRGRGEKSAAVYRRETESAQQEKENLERQLAEASVGFRRGTVAAAAGLAEVVSDLPADSTLVSFVRYQHHELPPAGRRPETPKASYVAMVAQHGDKEVAVIPLGDAKEIDSLLAIWRSQFSPDRLMRRRSIGERSYRTLAAALRRRIWDPIARRSGTKQHVFVVPDGPLHLLDFATLPTGLRDYLVEQRTFHYLSAERDILADIPENPARGLLITANPAFDARPTPAAPRGSDMKLFRGARSSCSTFRKATFETLRGASAEARMLTDLWKRRQGGDEGDVLHLSGSSATETAFKASAAGKRIIHLATHGFFLTGRCVSALGGSSSEIRGPDVAGENPLLLSGLVFAGANRRNRLRANDDDGILTAEEIASLDLSSVEWAVLSACDTGLGTIEAGEGVLGLRRAFHIAGAQTVIMSLWPVDDVTTRDWMKALYRNRMVERLSTAESVRKANLELLLRRRRKHLSTHPFHWSGFVAEGAWK